MPLHGARTENESQRGSPEPLTAADAKAMGNSRSVGGHGPQINSPGRAHAAHGSPAEQPQPR